jgi:L-lactate dehydrogenase complex protein LldF
MTINLSISPRRTPAPPPGTIGIGQPEPVASPAFRENAKRQLQNTQMRKNLRHATTTIRNKRLLRVAEVPNWEEVRSAGAALKDRIGRHLDKYLAQAEENLTKAGAHVHWARDAEEANRIITGIVKSKGVDEVVKIKSMVTQEIEMNEALEAAGIAAWETDLAELIVQLGHDRPSHILVPAIHRNREEVREIFNKEMGQYGTPPPDKMSNDPPILAGAARRHLREKFLRAKVGISGSNMVICDTGTVCIVESEGNGRMCLTLPETLISVVGVEKVIPTFDDLEVFMKLLPRSSTAERMNPYTSMWTGTTDGDGPQELHVVFVDNGRTNALADPEGRSALRCIRCSACMNICPIFERVGGHAYGSVYPGPIGIILTPQMRGINSAIDKSLPYASTLCCACADACPVKIPIPDIIVHLRNKIADKKKHDMHPHLEPTVMVPVNWMFNSAKHFEFVQKAVSFAAGTALKNTDYLGPMPWPASPWTRARDIPAPPAESFRQWWKKNRGGRR